MPSSCSPMIRKPPLWWWWGGGVSNATPSSRGRGATRPHPSHAKKVPKRTRPYTFCGEQSIRQGHKATHKHHWVTTMVVPAAIFSPRQAAKKAASDRTRAENTSEYCQLDTARVPTPSVSYTPLVHTVAVSDIEIVGNDDPLASAARNAVGCSSTSVSCHISTVLPAGEKRLSAEVLASITASRKQGRKGICASSGGKKPRQASHVRPACFFFLANFRFSVVHRALDPHVFFSQCFWGAKQHDLI